jgi:ferritin-like protein
MASDTYHEPLELLSGETRDMHRAIVSLMEELQAIDWYQQRADACAEPQLKAVLLHNKNEEIEHATMLMEWIRRHSEYFDEMMRKYLFTEAPIVGIEQGADADSPAAAVIKTLGIGSMKGK